MLDLLNRYAHGYVAVPVILSLRSKGIIAKLTESSPTCDQLANEFDANSGHLRVAIRMLESLGWCNVDSDSQIHLTEDASVIHTVPDDLLSLYELPIGASWATRFEPTRLATLTTRSVTGSHANGRRFADIIDGAFLVPLLLSLHFANASTAQPLFGSLPQRCRDTISELFVTKQWAASTRGTSELTAAGRTVLDRIPITGMVASYRPMLSRMGELLFGDANRVFRRDENGHESHLDRNLNVTSSGFQHDRYFIDLEEIVSTIFDQPPIDQQPCYIADMGCGDGTLLKRLYEKVRDDSARGTALDQYPLQLIGIDFNHASLEATSQTLAGLPHLVMKGDIAKPQQLLSDLKQLGIEDTENILHVRSFLDHDRPYQPPEDAEATNARFHVSHSGVYTGTDGRQIESTDVVQSLVEHLRRWSAITTRFGLIILEVHSLPPHVVRENIDECENFHYDAFHGFSGQLLVSPDEFLMAAAEAGLFPDLQSFRSYPKLLPFTRITLNRFQPRSYIVRHARPGDLEALDSLESECWNDKLRASKERIARRIARYPEGQFVLETDEGIAGVLYTQRIAGTSELESASDRTVEDLFDRNGRYAQLIAVNISPAQQQRGLGDELLEFVLQILRVTGDVERAVGVTRCQNYSQQSMPMDEYVALRSADSSPIDPILRFHDEHGAAITKLVPAYRPADVDNGGFGILIEYDLRQRQARRPGRLVAPSTVTLGDGDIASFVTSTIQDILGKDVDAYSPTETLLDLGLDSMSMLELRTVLSRHFQQELASTFLFEHDTANAIIRHFTR